MRSRVRTARGLAWAQHAAAIATANSSTSSSVVSHEHIQRTDRSFEHVRTTSPAKAVDRLRRRQVASQPRRVEGLPDSRRLESSISRIVTIQIFGPGPQR